MDDFLGRQIEQRIKLTFSKIEDLTEIDVDQQVREIAHTVLDIYKYDAVDLVGFYNQANGQSTLLSKRALSEDIR